MDGKNKLINDRKACPDTYYSCRYSEAVVQSISNMSCLVLNAHECMF